MRASLLPKNGQDSGRREAVKSVIRLLPGSVQPYLVELFRASEGEPAREHELLSALRSTLNTLAQEGTLPRRTFLQIAGLVVTGGLVPFLCPEKAHAWQTWTGFWQSVYSNPAATYTGTDLYWDYVVLLLQFDGANGSTVFADESNVGKAPTVTGAPFVSSAQSPYGTASLRLATSSDYFSFAASSDFVLSGDYTIELWLRLDDTAVRRICGVGGNLQVHVNGSNIYYTPDNSTFTQIKSGLSVNTWYHLAIVRQGTTLSFYFNGTLQTSVTASGSHGSSGSAFYIGWDGSSSEKAPGSYVSDFRIYNGVAKYTANFTTRTAPIGLGSYYDPYWGYCVLACPFENSIKDMSGGRFATVGSASLNSTTKKYGTASLALSGTSDAIVLSNTRLNLGSSDFTIEFYAYVTGSTGADQYVINTGGAGAGGVDAGYAVAILSGLNGLYLEVGNTAFSFTTTVSLSTWYHMAFSRRGNVLYCFVNGAFVGSQSMTIAVNDAASTDYTGIGGFCGLGNNNGYPVRNWFKGYIDSLRITKGYARYTANFTPPIAAFPVGKDETADPFWSNVVLAMHMDDLSDATGRHAATNNGSVTNSTSIYRYGSASASFSGSSQFLSFADSSDFAFGGGDFTIEFFAYSNSSSGSACLVGKRSSSGGCGPFLIWLVNGNVYFYLSSNGSSWDLVSALQFGSIPVSAWTHLAVTRRGSAVTLFKNGVAVNTATTSSALGVNTELLRIGGESSDSYFNGYIDDLRITKGIARYAQNFTPPTRAFVTSTSTMSWTSYITSGLVAYLDSGDSNSYLATSSPNLFSYSEQFDQWTWTDGLQAFGSGSVFNATTAPDGNTTADFLCESTANSSHRLNVSVSGSGSYTVSVYAKAGTRSKINLRLYEATVSNTATLFDLSSGSVISGTGSIQSVGNGWYRVSHTGSLTAAANGKSTSIEIANAANATSYAGDGSSGLYLWGAQLEQSPAATPYVRTPAATTNLLTYSEQADNAAWSKGGGTVTANTTSAPDGSSNADTFLEDSSTGFHYVNQSAAYTTGSTIAGSWFVKANGRTCARLTLQAASDNIWAQFDLSTGTLGMTYATGTGSVLGAWIQSVGNGWYRISLSGVPSTSATSVTFQINTTLTSTGSGNIAGDTSKGLYIWGAQLEVGSSATAYLPTTNASASRLSGTQVWRNLINQPADGSGAGAYDFYLGASSSSESSDPTFVGVSGGHSASDYFSMSGSQYLTLTGSNSTFINSMHKKGAQFTIIGVFMINSTGGYTLFGTSNYNAGNARGVVVMGSSTEITFTPYQDNGSNMGSLATSTGAISLGVPHFVAVSITEAGSSFIYLDGSYVVSPQTFTYSQTITTDAPNAAKIGTYADAGGRTINGRIYQLMLYNRALTKSELDTIFAAIRGRFGI